MKGLVTDRTQQNVLRRNALAAKGWSGMTDAERAEWIGSPLAVIGANVLPYAPYYSSSVTLRHTNDAVIAQTSWDGVYLYAVLIVGAASDFEGKTLTLSADSIVSADGGNPKIELYWHDNNGYEYAGGTLSSAGSTTFLTATNTYRREYLAAYIYVTQDASVSAGASARFGSLMLSIGSALTEYMPYNEVTPNDTTKGAYNYSDLNRVERAVAELSDLHGLNLTTKTDWGMWDIPTESDMARFLMNIKKVRQACMNPNEVSPAPESMSNLTYNDANNIEKILIAAHEHTDRIYRVGELFCGEV